MTDFPGHIPHWGEHKVPDPSLQDLMKNGPKVDKKLERVFKLIKPLIKNTDLV